MERTKGEISAGTIPILTSVVAKTASVAAIAISQTAVKPMPPAIAAP